MNLKKIILFLPIVLFFTNTNLVIAETAQPNIVMITIDVLRSDHLSLNGYERDTSPYLDSLTEESIYFDHVITNGSWTAPNTMTLLTGLHPDQHLVERNNIPNTDFNFLPEILSANGYVTSGFSSNKNIGPKYHFDTGFDYFFKPSKTWDISVLTDKASEWLDARDQNKPFFIYLHPMNVHGPYKSSDAIKQKFQHLKCKNKFKYYGRTMKGIMQQHHLEYRNNIKSCYLQDLTDQYDAAINYTDQEIEKFINKLKTDGLYDNTIIIVTADHGEELYDHLGFSHAYTMYQEILNTPLIIKPQSEAKDEILSMVDQRSEEYVQQIDVVPTILSMLTIAPTEEMLGQNLLDMQNYQSTKIVTKADWIGRGQGYSVIVWPYKLVYTYDDYQYKRKFFELYNLEKDPEEVNNIVSDNKKIKKQLWQKIRKKIVNIK